MKAGFIYYGIASVPLIMQTQKKKSDCLYYIVTGRFILTLLKSNFESAEFKLFKKKKFEIHRDDCRSVYTQNVSIDNHNKNLKITLLLNRILFFYHVNLKCVSSRRTYLYTWFIHIEQSITRCIE